MKPKFITCHSCLSHIHDETIYTRENCPVNNNILFDSYEEARKTTLGEISLVQCTQCGLIFNSSFDEELVSYNQTYNNSRSSSRIYLQYLDWIINLCASWIHDDDVVLEIGCGKGDFLRRLHDNIGCYGLGYDTTYVGEEYYGDRIRFSCEYFKPETTDIKYDVLIFRHVLEHIPNLFLFLSHILNHQIIKTCRHMFIEVPDIEWILRHRTFFDITYEHCNYFSAESLTNLVSRLGWNTITMNKGYGGQYLLLHANYSGESYESSSIKTRVHDCASRFSEFESIREWIYSQIRDAETVCVWGTSGKGIILLSELENELLEKIQLVIDIDPTKQGKYLPVSGKQISPPSVLKENKSDLLVLVMNEMYKEEIFNDLCLMGVNAEIIPCVFEDGIPGIL